MRSLPLTVPRQVKALRQQIEVLQTGLAQAKSDIETARKLKDKATKSRAALEEENERLSARIVEVRSRKSLRPDCRGWCH